MSTNPYSPERLAWHSMRNRCKSQTPRWKKYYGDRGITVCERWQQSFENFYADMGPRPARGYSLDRIDNDKGYSPDNCRWATQREQLLNRSVHPRINVGGEVMSFIEAHLALGLGYNTMYDHMRRHGCTQQQAANFYFAEQMVAEIVA